MQFQHFSLMYWLVSMGYNWILQMQENFQEHALGILLFGNLLCLICIQTALYLEQRTGSSVHEVEPSWLSNLVLCYGGLDSTIGHFLIFCIGSVLDWN